MRPAIIKYLNRNLLGRNYSNERSRISGSNRARRGRCSFRASAPRSKLRQKTLSRALTGRERSSHCSSVRKVAHPTRATQPPSATRYRGAGGDEGGSSDFLATPAKIIRPPNPSYSPPRSFTGVDRPSYPATPAGGRRFQPLPKCQAGL